MNARASLSSATAALVLIILARVLFSQAAAASPVTVLSKDGRRTLATSLANDQEVVALEDLAAMFQLTVRDEAGAVTVSYKGKTIVLTPDQALASVAGRLVSLPAPLSRGTGRRWIVPVEFISRALAPIYDTRLDLRKPTHLLVVGDLRVPRITLRYEPLGTAGRVTIDAAPPAASTVTQENDRLSIKFAADALDLGSPSVVFPPQSLVQAVRLAEPVTLTLELSPRFAAFKATQQATDSVAHLVLDLVSTQTDTATPTPAPPPSPGAPPATPGPADAAALGPPPSSIRTIAIDPGHGGEDEGATGAAGAKEKDVVLAVARRAKAAIEARLGIRVMLTRDDDRNVPIDDRTAMANNNKADVFISLHANASFRKSVTGASVLSAAFNDHAAQQARASLSPERLPTFGGGLRDIELVPWDLAQITHVDASVQFANILADQLKNRIPLSGRAVDSAPLRVLESANMPAILVELGYMSNADQEKQLAAAEFQNAFVQALFDAVLKFRDALDESRRTTAGGGR